MKMRHAMVAIAMCVFGSSAHAADTAATRAVRALLHAQRADWNRADIDAFMKGYWKDPSIRFAGGDDFRYGWQATIDRYRKAYPDAASMGTLDFELLEVRPLSHAVVYVFGKWHLARTIDAPDKAPHGLFTLIVEKKGGRWVVTRDHTSSAGE